VYVSITVTSFPGSNITTKTNAQTVHARMSAYNTVYYIELHNYQYIKQH